MVFVPKHKTEITRRDGAGVWRRLKTQSPWIEILSPLRILTCLHPSLLLRCLRCAHERFAGADIAQFESL